MLEDWRLVKRFNRGDREAFRSIYDKYRADLLRVAHVLLYDRTGIEDVVQDVMVHFAAQSGRFRLTGSLKGYLAVCVANRSRDLNRATLRNQARQLELNPERTEVPGDPLCFQQTKIQLENALNQLPPEQVEIIVLHVQQGLRFREIARQLETSINTIMSRYRYGLEKLRTLLEEKR
jgi:RNA polymerase sigma-70 factor, ECF subfamily